MSDTTADPVLLVITNLPNAEAAAGLARMLVEARVAACVNIMPAVRSIYQWQGQLEEAQETPLFIKTTRSRYAALEQMIRIAHAYELPEIIALPVECGLPAYLNWVAQETAV